MGVCPSSTIEAHSSGDLVSLSSTESTKGRIIFQGFASRNRDSRLKSSEKISFEESSSELRLYEDDEESMSSDSVRFQFLNPDCQAREETITFDGLNKRYTNRNSIGLEILKAQIHHGADPKKLRTHGDRTCLMFAVIAEDFSFIKNLVQRGVDVKETNRQGETALRFAIELGREDIANFLRTRGA